MSEPTRRELLHIGMALQVHQHVAEEKTAQRVYRPSFFKEHEYATLSRLAELVVPGSVQAGTPEFIDVLCSGSGELAAIFTGGLAWLDREAERRYRASFAAAQPAQQTALLDLIAYRKNETPELAPGIRFFAWARNLVLDGYYTSPMGMKELGFVGNGAMSTFSVPKEAVEYALKRVPEPLR